MGSPLPNKHFPFMQTSRKMDKGCMLMREIGGEGKTTPLFQSQLEPFSSHLEYKVRLRDQY